MTTIIEVTNSRELRKFIDFPHSLYKFDQNYTPELFITQKELFDKKKNPFYKNAKAELLMAVEDGLTLGRIVVFRDDHFIRHTGKKECFFGFFECVDNYQVAELLFDEAMIFAKKEKLPVMSGPLNYTIHDSCGLLINGFEKPAFIGMPYNKPYYKDFVARYGFSKKIDLFAYELQSATTPIRITRSKEILEERLLRKGIIVRSLNFKNFESEIKNLHVAYNDAFIDNWGFFPLPFDDFHFRAKDIKAVADEEMILIAEKDERTVGFMITLPNINLILQKIQNGRLFPFGLFKLLYFKNKVDSCRISVAGVSEQFRNLGIESIFFAKEYEIARKKGIKTAEASYVMEDNTVMINILKSIDAKKTKMYRIYELLLS